MADVGQVLNSVAERRADAGLHAPGPLTATTRQWDTFKEWERSYAFTAHGFELRTEPRAR